MLTYKDLLLAGPEAVCVLGTKLEIRECNQLARLLLGYRDKGLVGRYLSDIIYDDLLIRQMMTARSRDGWSQGECTLKTSSGLPLMAKFRAGSVMDDGLTDVHHAAAEPQTEKAGNKSYVLVFREANESKHPLCELWFVPGMPSNGRCIIRPSCMFHQVKFQKKI